MKLPFHKLISINRELTPKYFNINYNEIFNIFHAMAESDKYKTRAAGQLVVKALEQLAVPCTLTNIVEWIISRTPGDPVELVQMVRRTLSKGLTLGFVDALQRRYFLTSNRDWHDHDKTITFVSATKRSLEEGVKQQQSTADVEVVEPPAKRSKSASVAFSDNLVTKRKLLVHKNKKQMKRKRQRL